MYKQFSLSIIIPVYNEEKTLKNSISIISKFLEKNFEDYEIIIIESGSTDNSAEICDGIADSSKNVKVIHESERNGFGAALKLGYKKASKDLVMLFTVDFPFPLESIYQALPLLTDYDCVLSYRVTDNRNIFRKFQSSVFNYIINWYFGLSVQHVNSAFKLFRKEFIQNAQIISDGWLIDTEIHCIIKKQNISFTEIPVPAIERTVGKSSIGLLTPLSMITEMIELKKKLRNQ